MGKMNLLKANWEGKVGQTVGAKWKDKSTIRTYTKPSNPDTEAQRTVRTAFGDMTAFVALFSDQIKYLSALNTRGMSVRNAIIKANKAQIDTGTFDPATLLVSKGGLPNVTGAAAAYSAGKVTVTGTKPVATNISDQAQFVAVVADKTGKRGFANVADLGDTPSVEVDTGTLEAGEYDVYAYILDKRGSSKVGSNSVHLTVTVA